MVQISALAACSEYTSRAPIFIKNHHLVLKKCTFHKRLKNGNTCLFTTQVYLSTTCMPGTNYIDISAGKQASIFIFHSLKINNTYFLCIEHRLFQ